MKKKISAIEAATSGFKQNIMSLEEMSSNLIGRSHYDSHNIRTKQVNISVNTKCFNFSLILNLFPAIHHKLNFFSRKKHS